MPVGWEEGEGVARPGGRGCDQAGKGEEGEGVTRPVYERRRGW